MSQLKSYPQYKESGVEWIGEIPKGWNIVKLKYLTSITTGSKDTQDKVKNGSYPFFVRSDKIENINIFTHNEEAVMTAGDGVGVGKVFHYYKGKFTAHQRVYLFRNFKNSMGKFIYFYMKSNLIFEVMQGTAKSTVDSLRRSMLTEFPVSLPSVDIQNSIVKFISLQTSEIDNLISDKERLIELLEEKRQAVLTETVTKGLDPSVEMKDSGIEWIGEIPEHWAVNKLKYHSEIIMGQSIDTIDISMNANDVPFLQGNADFGRLNPSPKNYCLKGKKHSKKEDILLSVRAPVGALNISNQKYAIGRGLSAIRVHSKYVSYYWFALKVFKEELQSEMTGSTFEAVTIENVKNLTFLVPSNKEMILIGKNLDIYDEEVDQIIKEIQIQISKLKEYRESLIYEAVTGKIDVRDYATETEDVY